MVDPLGFASKLAQMNVPVRIGVDELPNTQLAHFAHPLSAHGHGGNFAWGGDKWAGSFGITKLFVPNYWQLRTRSDQLFHENLYARGLIRRLLTAEINTGLTLESEPNHDLIPSLTEDQAQKWSDDVEARFNIWASTPKLCDFEQRRTFPQLQKTTRREALVSGDVLVVLRHPRAPGLPPRVQLIRGARVATPLDKAPPRVGNRIVHGVEMNARGEHVAFHVQDSFTKSTRIPVFGERSGKRMAWLVYGTDHRQDDVRGQPLLSIILQSLKELDRYRDSEQRAATVNSLLAMFVTKEKGTLGTKPLTGGALRNDRLTGTGLDGEARQYHLANSYPGLVMEELNAGEVPHSFDTRRPNVNYPLFEEAVVAGIAWAQEIPPEVLRLAFSSNYSASKAAINEFKAYISAARQEFGGDFCQPVFCEWLITEALADRIGKATQLLTALRDAQSFTEFGAWVLTQWGGPVKPSIELSKDVKAYGEAIKLRLIARDRACRDLFGVRFSDVLRRIKREKKQLEDIGGEGEPGVVPPVIGDLPPVPGAPPSPAMITEERVLELAEELFEERTATARTPLHEVA